MFYPNVTNVSPWNLILASIEYLYKTVKFLLVIPEVQEGQTIYYSFILGISKELTFAQQHLLARYIKIEWGGPFTVLYE